MGIPLKLSNQKLESTKFPLGMVNSTPFYSLEELQKLSSNLEKSLTDLKDTQNKKLASLMEATRILFVYEDEELNDNFKPYLNILIKKGLLFTYLDLSGKTSMKNIILKKFPECKLPCVIVDNKTIVPSGKNVFIS
jgi:hypothetical protein